MIELTAEQRQELERVRDTPAPTRFEALSDAGNARRFVTQHGHMVRFNATADQWLIWDGSRFAPDRTGQRMDFAKQTARSIFAEASKEEDEAMRRKIARHALRSENVGRLDAMLKLASTELEIVVLPEQLDTDPHLLCCLDAVIDLKTGKVMKPDPAFLMTRSTGIPWNPEATCPRFDRFLLEIFEGDQELIEFTQRWVGYGLTGSTKEHKLWSAYGPKGRGGKSVLANTIRNVMGDYAAVADFSTFTRSRGDEGPGNDLARLDGARMVFASEGQAGRRLDEATVKALTGGDPIVARFLYAETFEFTPQFKIWLTTNRRPRIDGGDEAIWARVREVPFMADFRGREDRDLEATLKTELPGILRWAFEGAVTWHQEGLGTAKAVEASTADYRAGEDVLGAFLAERCAEGGEVLTAALRDAFAAYCEEIGEEPFEARVLGRELATRGITRGGKGRRFYKGVSLK